MGEESKDGFVVSDHIRRSYGFLTTKKTGLACVREGWGGRLYRIIKTTACSRAPREEKNRETNKKQQQQQKLTLEVKVYSIPETSVFQIEIRTFSVWMVKSHDVRLSRTIVVSKNRTV